MRKLIQTFCALTVAACLTLTTGCGGQSTPQEEPEGYAAIVDDYQIEEDRITTAVNVMRSNYGLIDDEDWADFLDEQGMTAQDMRESAIWSYVETYLVLEELDRRGIEVDDDAVDVRLSEMIAYYDELTEGGWKQYRTSLGFSSDDVYRESLRDELRLALLQDDVAGDIEPTDEDVAAYFELAAPLYAGSGGAYIAVANASDAAALKSHIDAGTITFEEAALTYSLAHVNDYAYAYEMSNEPLSIPLDAASVQAEVEATRASYGNDDVWELALQSAGDLGWFDAQTLSDSEDAFVAVLAGLTTGQVSDPVDVGEGYLLIKCTGTYDPNVDGTDISKVDERLVAQITEEVRALTLSGVWSDFVAHLVEDADVEISEMPEGLPYDVETSRTDPHDVEAPVTDSRDVEASRTSSSSDE